MSSSLRPRAPWHLLPPCLRPPLLPLGRRSPSALMGHSSRDVPAGNKGVTQGRPAPPSAASSPSAAHAFPLIVRCSPSPLPAAPRVIFSSFLSRGRPQRLLGCRLGWLGLCSSLPCGCCSSSSLLSPFSHGRLHLGGQHLSAPKSGSTMWPPSPTLPTFPAGCGGRWQPLCGLSSHPSLAVDERELVIRPPTRRWA